ncbi:hypothetical protein AVEN_137791-1 [Araneus ventricosus]|uniref:Uncharacterized protein n=1 Tax=Araneus ventricosus TaxID=182803 RepID=A0A4Y2LAM9_ARAVE|nr:hypothetical protein AVEN_137791-1 [Araneus ventricosus]
MDRFDPVLGRDLSDRKYRFALDIVITVWQRHDGTPIWELRKLGNSLFNGRHKTVIKSYQPTQEENFIKIIQTLANGTFDSNTFKVCLENFTNIYKPKQYSEARFVKFCSTIAFLGIFFSQKSAASRGIDMAVDIIISLLSDVLSRGTLRQSSWS